MNTEKNSTIAKRYAKSLMDTTKSDGISAEKMLEDLKNIEAILKSSDELYFAMTNPIISVQDKEEIIDAVFNKDANETARNMLKLLIDKNRFNFIYSIINHFRELTDELNNTVNVNVTCAIELDENRKNEIQTKLREKLNKTVNVDYEINENIIAGLVYKIGDDVIDTSVFHKIEELKKEILK